MLLGKQIKLQEVPSLCLFYVEGKQIKLQEGTFIVLILCWGLNKPNCRKFLHYVYSTLRVSKSNCRKEPSLCLSCVGKWKTLNCGNGISETKVRKRNCGSGIAEAENYTVEFVTSDRAGWKIMPPRTSGRLRKRKSRSTASKHHTM